MRSIKRLGLSVFAAAVACSSVCLPAEAGADGASTTAAVPGKTLTNYNWIGQINSYYCGPATAKILIQGMKNYGKISSTRSVTTPSWDFSQPSLADDMYLDANDNGTQRADMREGLVKWTRKTWIQVYSNPTPAKFKERLGSNVRTGYGLAVATQENVNGAHYNNHPSHLYVGHWIVARGYTTDYGKTHFVDPVAERWGVPRYFSESTNDFVNRFVRPVAIVG